MLMTDTAPRFETKVQHLQSFSKTKQYSMAVQWFRQ